MRQMAKHLCHTISAACGSALFAALLLARGRAGRVPGGNRTIGVLLLHPISDVIGNHDRDHDHLNGIPDDSRIAKGGFLKKEALTDEVLKKIKALNELDRKSVV